MRGKEWCDMNWTSVQDWLAALNAFRKVLKMPWEALAERAKLSRATVCRILGAKDSSPKLPNVFAIAHALGAEFTQRGGSFTLTLPEPDALVEQQVMVHARRIARSVQGTMALESQGLIDQKDIDQLVETAAQEIRARPRSQLWINQCRSSSRSPVKRRLAASLN
jgi:transcriptional regulator with XRE-family HTH domain